ncbi:MAG: hypothetical protein HY761_08605 [Candidatus Omnitrophica bacterium]|nr:hypothetical protein [Candidatus Omnitrophota bacterium]
MSLNEINNRKLLWYAIPAIIFYSALYFFRGMPFTDDSFIGYRYAVNWASGYGPVYNVGEYVEGFTDPLRIALLAAGVYFSLDPVNFAPLLNLFVGVICFFLISYLCGFISFSSPRLMAVILPLFCAFSYGFYYHSATGMDTAQFSLGLLLCIVSLYRSKNTADYLSAIPFLALLNIIRADGFIYGSILLIVLTVFIFLENRKIPRKLLLTIAVFTCWTATLFIIRYNIFNEWVPTTIISKAYASFEIKKAVFDGDFQALKRFIWVIFRGIQYVSPLFFVGAWIPFIVLLRDKDKKNDLLLWLFASLIAINVIVSIWAGGDYFFHNRFNVQVLPMVIIFTAWSIDLLIKKYWDNSFRNKVLMTGLIILIFSSWIVFFVKPSFFVKKYGAVKGVLYRQEIGMLLRDTPVATILLTDMAGIVPYYAGSRVYVRDLYGFTDLHNAKYGNVWCIPEREISGICGRGDFNYSYSAPFDIIIYGSNTILRELLSFCKTHPTTCNEYQFLMKDEWLREEIFVVASINHPVTKTLINKFNLTPLTVNNDLFNIIDKYR